MRKLNALLPVALFCFSFSFGCGVLGEDEQAPQTLPSSSETYGAPIGNPSADSNEDGEEGLEDGNRTSDLTPSDAPAAPADPPASEDPPADASPAQPDPGPAPTSQCKVEKDGNGFFWRTSAKSEYVAYVPASYSPSKPMRVIVGLHGCSDNAMNFATWGVNPAATRAKQQHIGISVSGETGNNKCWSVGGDDAKVLAAVEDLAKCFWVDRSKVVVAGFSSGGQLAYRVGMMNASAFAGILIENSGLYAAGSASDKLLAGAAWKLPVAHRAHTQDSVFPIAKVKADWTLMNTSGFPVTTSEVAGPHDGNSDDWANWLIPQSASWVRK